jgi:hypothetical protein
MGTPRQGAASLPTKRTLALAYAISGLIAVLAAAAPVTGLLFSSAVYPTDELLQAFLANDLVVLFVGLPMLLGSMWLARRGQLTRGAIRHAPRPVIEAFSERALPAGRPGQEGRRRLRVQAA